MKSHFKCVKVTIFFDHVNRFADVFDKKYNFKDLVITLYTISNSIKV